MDFETFQRFNIDAPFHPKRTDGTGSGWSNVNKDGRRGSAGSMPLLPIQDDLKVYPLPDLSTLRRDVPRGSVTRHKDWTSSRVFPGTTRNWWLYVPAQHKHGSTEDANLIVFTDGLNNNAVTTLDNLLAEELIPVTIAVFVAPGIRTDGMLPEGDAPDPFIIRNKEGKAVFQDAQRSFEYDSITERFSEFLLTDLLPLVERDYCISGHPWRRAVQGASSGAIAAFMAAWYRPDKFGCVISWIGTYVNIRGAHELPWVVRNSPRKPIRIFLQSGERDLDNSHGNWPLANKTMASALEYAGYDYRFEFGTGGHNITHGISLLGETLLW